MYNISVGIPVYGEERNIGALLSSILKQKIEGIKVIEIIVIADECSDETLHIINEFSKKDSRIRVYYHNMRRGKAASLNEVFERSKGDFLVLFDADVIPTDNYVISNLIRPLISDSNIGLVGGLPIPLPPTNLIERASLFSDKIQHYIKEHINKGKNVYAAHGRVLALSSQFMKKVQIPSIPGDDAYLYFKCIALNFDFHYVGHQASVYYRVSGSVEDYLHQSIRFKRVQGIMWNLFGHMAKKEFGIPKGFLFHVLFKHFLRDPLGGFLWVFLFIYASIKSIKKTKVPSKWEISESSKILMTRGRSEAGRLINL